MPSEPLQEDVLKSIPESRRDFLKKVIAGTTFVVPLIASFSMDGLSIDTPEADAFCPNQAIEGPLSPPLVFLAKLQGGQRSSKGTAHFKLTPPRRECVTMDYKITGFPHLTFINADLVQMSTNSVLLTLLERKGTIESSDVVTLEQLVDLMEMGDIEVRVFTVQETLVGVVRDDD
jgi:hypothetical protein